MSRAPDKVELELFDSEETKAKLMPMTQPQLNPADKCILPKSEVRETGGSSNSKQYLVENLSLVPKIEILVFDSTNL